MSSARDGVKGLAALHAHGHLIVSYPARGAFPQLRYLKILHTVACVVKVKHGVMLITCDMKWSGYTDRYVLSLFRCRFKRLIFLVEDVYRLLERLHHAKCHWALLDKFSRLRYRSDHNWYFFLTFIQLSLSCSELWSVNTKHESYELYNISDEVVSSTDSGSVPGLQLQRSLFARNLKRVRVIVIERLHHFHPIDADARANRKLLPYEAELGYAVQQHVVELWKIW